MCGVFSCSHCKINHREIEIATRYPAKRRGWTDGIKSHDVNLLCCCCYLAWIFSHSLSRPRRLTISTFSVNCWLLKKQKHPRKIRLFLCAVFFFLFFFFFFVKSFVLPHERQFAFNGDPYGGNISHEQKRNNVAGHYTGHQTRVNLYTFLRIAYMSIWVYKNWIYKKRKCFWLYLNLNNNVR